MNTLSLTLKKKLSTLFLLSSIFLISACSSIVSDHHAKQTHSSSLANFLYPNKQTKVSSIPQIPHLNLPIKIGLAFLPSQHWRGSHLDTSNQYQLLSKIKAGFSQHKFIHEIKIIPSSYLRYHKTKKSSGFDTLDQLGRLHDVDVIALVSYDQLTQTLHNNASLLYWTIVGMYVIPGNENSIQTFVDTAVFDVKSRKLLLRAPGISKINKRSTAIDVDAVMKSKSIKGFNLAFNDMIKNLDQELLIFREKVKDGKTVKIENLESYSAGGGLDTILLLGLFSFIIIRRLKIPV